MKKTMLSGMAAATVAMTVGYFGVTTYADRDRDPGSLSPGQGAEDTPGTTEGVEPRDVVCSRLGLNSFGSGNDFAYWGTSGGIRGFTAASTSCNVGGQTAQWQDGSQGRHPCIGQNLYRLKDGRFEQIGMSWLKHSFCAVSETTCGSCQSTGCSTLGVGCADTYTSGMNANTNDLGPREQINPWPTESNLTPTHTDPHPTPSGATPSAIRGKLQVRDEDILAGGTFFYEVHYITHDELYSKRQNNASHRIVNVNLTSINTTGIPNGSGQNSVVRLPAIFGWRAQDPSILLKPVKIPDDGYVYIGTQVYDNGDGTWDYEHAIYNMNSARGIMSFEAMLPEGVNVSNVGFHDVSYHSGENISGTDWTVTEGSSGLKWSTESFTTASNANAIRWSTLYNFRYTADSEPGLVEHNFGLFTPGTPDAMNGILSWGPSPKVEACLGDADGSGDVGVDDLIAVIQDWDTDGSANGGDVSGDGIVDVDDLTTVILNWGLCP